MKSYVLTESSFERMKTHYGENFHCATCVKPFVVGDEVKVQPGGKKLYHKSCYDGLFISASDRIMPQDRGVTRRTLGNIKAWLNAAEIYKLITAKSWPYKGNIPFYQARDKALMAIDFVGAFRNNEPLRNLRKSNFKNENNYLILTEGKISKRSEKLIAKYGNKITVREDIRFPKFAHPLQPFTDLVLDYLELLQNDDVLFAFGERRHHQIVMFVTGQWPHWFRAMGENWYGHNVFRNDSLNLAKFIGVMNVQSVMGYTGFDEESYIKRLKQNTQDTH